MFFFLSGLAEAVWPIWVLSHTDDAAHWKAMTLLKFIVNVGCYVEMKEFYIKAHAIEWDEHFQIKQILFQFLQFTAL